MQICTNYEKKEDLVKLKNRLKLLIETMGTDYESFVKTQAEITKLKYKIEAGEHRIKLNSYHNKKVESDSLLF